MVRIIYGQLLATALISILFLQYYKELKVKEIEILQKAESRKEKPNMKRIKVRQDKVKYYNMLGMLVLGIYGASRLVTYRFMTRKFIRNIQYNPTTNKFIVELYRPVGKTHHEADLSHLRIETLQEGEKQREVLRLLNHPKQKNVQNLYMESGLWTA